MNPVCSSNLNLITTLRLFSFLNQFIFRCNQLVTKLLPKISNQSIKAVQFWLTLSVTKLINVAFYFWVKLKHFIQKLVDLNFIPLEFSVLLVQIIDKPNCVFVEFEGILILAVFADHRNIKKVNSNHFQNLYYFFTHIFGVNHLSVLVIFVW